MPMHSPENTKNSHSIQAPLHLFSLLSLRFLLSIKKKNISKPIKSVFSFIPICFNTHKKKNPKKKSKFWKSNHTRHTTDHPLSIVLLYSQSSGCWRCKDFQREVGLGRDPGPMIWPIFRQPCTPSNSPALPFRSSPH